MAGCYTATSFLSVYNTYYNPYISGCKSSKVCLLCYNTATVCLYIYYSLSICLALTLLQSFCPDVTLLQSLCLAVSMIHPVYLAVTLIHPVYLAVSLIHPVYLAVTLDKIFCKYCSVDLSSAELKLPGLYTIYDIGVEKADAEQSIAIIALTHFILV